MPNPPSAPIDWDPEEYFNRAATRRGMTAEQLRAQLRGLADESRASAHHVSFEHLRDGVLSDSELTHLDQCQYCSRFLQAVNPQPAEVERFVATALARFEPQYARVAAKRSWKVPTALAASVTVGILGVTAYFNLQRAREVTAMKPPASTEAMAARCQQASGKVSGCLLFADAVRYQIDGDSKTAQELVTRGLVKAGVSTPVVAEVAKTLRTDPATPQDMPRAVAQANAAASAVSAKVSSNASEWLDAARLHLEARQDTEAYLAVGHYLKSSAPQAQSTAYLVGFAQPVQQIGSIKSAKTELTQHELDKTSRIPMTTATK